MAISVTNIDDITPGGWPPTGWKPVCILPTCNPGGVGIPTATSQTINNATPSRSGSSMQLSVTGPAFTNALWAYIAGADETLLTYTNDFWIWVGPNAAVAGSVEIDMFNFSPTDNKNYMMGTQYNYVTGKWQVWDGNAVDWVDTGVTQGLTLNGWTHVQQAAHRVAGDTSSVYFDYIIIDGTTHWYSGSTGTTLRKPSQVLEVGFASAVGIQFQIDIGSAGSGGSPVVINIDNVNFTATAADGSGGGSGGGGGGGTGSGGSTSGPPQHRVFTIPQSAGAGTVGGISIRSIVDNVVWLAAAVPGPSPSDVINSVNLTTGAVGGWVGPNAFPPPAGWVGPQFGFFRSDGTWYNSYSADHVNVSLNVSNIAGTAANFASLGAYTSPQQYGANTSVVWQGVKYTAWLVGDDGSVSGGGSLNLYVFDGAGGTKSIAVFPMPSWVFAHGGLSSGILVNANVVTYGSPIAFDYLTGNFYVSLYDITTNTNWTLFKSNIDTGFATAYTYPSSPTSMVYNIWVDPVRRSVLGLQLDGSLQVINSLDGSISKVVSGLVPTIVGDGFPTPSDWPCYLTQGLVLPTLNWFMSGKDDFDNVYKELRRICAPSTSIIDDPVVPTDWGLTSDNIPGFGPAVELYSGVDNSLILLGDYNIGTGNPISLYELFMPSSRCGSTQQPRITISC